MRPIDEIADRYVVDAAALDPHLATFVGITGHDDEVTDYSPDGFAERDALRRRALAELAVAQPTDERERVAQHAMKERLGLEAEMHMAGADVDLNVVDSPMQSLRQVFDLMPTATADDWAVVARRLAATPDGFSAYRRTLAAGAAAGRVPARRQVLGCASQAEEWASADGFFAGLVSASGDGAGVAAGDVQRGAEACAEAATAFARWLREDLAPHASERDAVGRDRYALGSRYFLGATVDLDETYAWGWDEVARLEAEMAAVADRIAPGGSVDDAVAALDEDPGRTIGSAEEFRAWMQDLADRTIAEMAGTHFDIPEPVRRIECMIAPTHDGSIYYTPPSEDFSRPGRMWWSVPEGVDSFSTWREVTTVFHEGVPGHHLQIAQTVYRRELLNRWQRTMCWVSGHGEGWALYAERLMAELGHLDDPGDRLGMLDAQLFRAARVVVDIGMHLELPAPAGHGFHEGERFTPELGWEFLRGHCRMADEVLRFELDRYLGWPGQAPSYKVGERIWLEARADAERRHGAGFDLAAFHRQALDLGALGLDPLREALARV